MRNDLRPEPVVAVIGKPNVGKSALFNRLVRRRKAIVSDEPGVTRDVNYERVTTPRGSYLLADSAGLTGRRGDGFSKTQEFNRRLIDEAALVLFTCEAPEPTAEDHLVAEIVRKSGKPCVVVVNKIDREKFDDAAHGFYGFGFGEPVPVSAIHGTNIPLLERRILETLPQGLLDARRGDPASDVKTPRTANPPATEDTEGTRSDLDRRIGVAIVGKPNVGKSSLLNLLTGKERALVTAIPGTTRDAVDEEVEFRGFTLRLIDTAGLRKRGKIRENVEYYSLIRAEEAVRASSLSILLLDATEKISIQDKKIASIVVDEKKGLIVAANKWDLAEAAGITLETFKEDLLYFFPHIAFAAIVPVSAKTGYNKIKLLEKILDVYHNYNRRVKTSELNSLIRQFSSRGSTVKYGYQKSAAPPVFEFFVGGGVKKDRSFQRFVLNSVRKCFDFTGVPIDILLRKNS